MNKLDIDITVSWIIDGGKHLRLVLRFLLHKNSHFTLPIIFARMHLCVFQSELFSKQHECIHGSFSSEVRRLVIESRFLLV